jgi:hypothetical protein
MYAHFWSTYDLFCQIFFTIGRLGEIYIQIC